MSEGRTRQPTVAVLVLAADREATLERCLEGLAGQRGRHDFMVVVVDTAPSRGAADTALRHPGVHWVVPTSQTGLAALCRRAMGVTKFDRLALLDGAYRPDAGWLDHGLTLLDEGVDVVVGASGHGRFTHMFVSSQVPGRFRIEGSDDRETADLDQFVRRCEAAGMRVSHEGQGDVSPISGPPPLGIARGAEHPPVPGLAPMSIRRGGPAPATVEKGLISVVVCSGGKRPDQLQRCLDSLCRLEDWNFEIVLVDNAASPAVKLDQLPTGVKYVHEPRRGLDRARNRGIMDSAGDIVAFVDDDCDAHPDWLAGIRGAFSDPFVSFVTGRVRPAGLRGEPQQWFEAHFSFDRGPCSRRFTRLDYGGRSPLLMGELGTGANMAFRRGVLERIGGFDEKLDMGTLIGGGGDLDVFGRALEDGAVGHYAADAVVFHHHRDSIGKLRWQTWGYGLTQGAMCAKCLVSGRGHRLHAVVRYFRLLRDRQRELAAGRKGIDRYPSDLIGLELLGIAVGPLAYLASGVRRSAAKR